jgi:Skp family chaperone for outer membrane proteins
MDSRRTRGLIDDAVRQWQSRLSLTLLRSKTFGVTSKPGESERDFRIHLRQIAHEQRDQKVAALRARYGDRVAKLDERIFAAQQRVAKEQADVRKAQVDMVSNVGAAFLGAIFGGGRGSMATRAARGGSTAARGYGRSQKESQDAALAGEKLDQLIAQRDELLQELQSQSDAIAQQMDPLLEELEPIAIKPRKADIDIRLVTLLWRPRTL